MELLRVPSLDTNAEIAVASPSISYDYTVTDLEDRSQTSGSAVSSVGSVVTIPIPSAYDGSYVVAVDSTETYVDVVRPYVDPTTQGATPAEIEAYSENELQARAIIDSVVPEGFYYKKHIIETTGLGADYIPLWVDAHKILKLYENNVLLYDSSDPSSYSTSYSITHDRTAIVENYTGGLNRLESANLVMPTAATDLLNNQLVYRGFPKTFDYEISLVVGYPNLPTDIVKAAKLLVDDISCGRLDHTQRYMKSYSTDQFKVSFDNRAFEGTGNLVVDKILSNYAKSIRTIGVL